MYIFVPASKQNLVMKRQLYFILLITLLPLINSTQFSVTGKIINHENGDPLTGANILLKGTSIATVSDNNGSYYFKRLKKGFYTIKISYIGFKTIETELDVNSAPDGWNYLGSYYLAPGTAKVDLSNETNGRYVLADAIKWVLR